MRKRILDYNPWTGTTTYHSYDPTTDTTYIEEKFDTNVGRAIVERNKRMQADDRVQAKIKSRHKDIRWVAQIPIQVQHHWLQEYHLDVYKMHNRRDNAEVRKFHRLLNDPEWKYLKTVTGKV